MLRLQVASGTGTPKKCGECSKEGRNVVVVEEAPEAVLALEVTYRSMHEVDTIEGVYSALKPVLICPSVAHVILISPVDEQCREVI